jgi:uncharacterized membrane protein
MARLCIVAQYIVLFLIYSIVGSIVEMLYRLITEHQLYGIHGFLHIPILPIYGFGAILIILLLEKIHRKPLLLFIVATILASLIEFVTHWLIEVLFHIKLWDYSGDPFNISGRIDLYSSVGFGLLAVLLVNVIHPFFRRVVKRMSMIVTTVAAGIIVVVILADTIISIIQRMS